MPAVLARDVHTRPSASTLLDGPRSRPHEMFLLWCELTGRDPARYDLCDVEAFLARPEVAALAAAPDAVLRTAASDARRGHSLPLERWLVALLNRCSG